MVGGVISSQKPKQKNPFHRIEKLLIACWVFGFFFMGWAYPILFKDTGKAPIRVLIDRIPNTLDPSQNPDMTARRILPLITEFGYRPHPQDSLEDFTLTPPDLTRPEIQFKVVRDDLSRGLLFESGRADVLFDSLSLSKTAHYRDSGKTVIVEKGFHLSYLGFNLRHPILMRPEVRRAIEKALPISEWILHKYFGFVEALPEGGGNGDPAEAAKELSRAGLIPDSNGVRFKLTYLTTPVREGNELALLVRAALAQVGIRIEVIPLEPSLFFSKLNKGEFDLFGSRIPRSNPKEAVADFFMSKGRRNYFSYSNPELDRSFSQDSKLSLEQVLPTLRRDLPVIPLFTWNHGLLLSSRVLWPTQSEMAIDDSFRFLARLQLK